MEQLQEVLLFMKKRAKSTEVQDQLHAVWSVSLSQRTTDGQFYGERFCIVLNYSWPLLPLETEFFETARAGKGSYRPSYKSRINNLAVPVIAIFTKFDDLITQIYDIDQDEEVNRQNAEEIVERKFRKPLYSYASPPHADVCFEGTGQSCAKV